MKTIIIELALLKGFDLRKNIIVPNVSWGLGLHECDMLILSQSKYATEIEIKVSKQDLLNDKKKFHKHKSDKIKYFYFAVPEELEKFAIENIPERAGLIVIKKISNYYDEDFYCPQIVKKAILNKESKPWNDNDVLHLAHLGTMRIFSLKKKIAKKENLLKENVIFLKKAFK